MHGDVFRPKLPLDPFAPQPWRIDPDTINISPQVILILGVPSYADVAPLLTSSWLANSLVLLVTHAPPLIPQSTVRCSLRVLRLLSPLNLHGTGAVQLVSILERSEHIARQWRKSPFTRSIAQFREASCDGEFNVAEDWGAHNNDNQMGRNSSSSKPKLPRADPCQRAFDTVINFLPPSLTEKAALKHAILVTTLSHPFLAAPSPQRSPPHQTPTPASSQTPSRASSRPPSPPACRRRFSTFSLARLSQPASWQSRPRLSHFWPRLSSADADTTKVFQSECNVFLRARVAHILPSTLANPKLIRSIERFLVSFSYHPIYSNPSNLVDRSSKLYASTPPSSRSSVYSFSSSSSTQSRPGSPHPTRKPNQVAMSKEDLQMEKPLPFLLPASAMAAIPRPATEYSNVYGDGGGMNLIELVLFGALDRKISGLSLGMITPNNDLTDKPDSTRPQSTFLRGLAMLAEADGGAPRAWISGVDDVRWSVLLEGDVLSRQERQLGLGELASFRQGEGVRARFLSASESAVTRQRFGHRHDMSMMDLNSSSISTSMNIVGSASLDASSTEVSKPTPQVVDVTGNGDACMPTVAGTENVDLNRGVDINSGLPTPPESTSNGSSTLTATSTTGTSSSSSEGDNGVNKVAQCHSSNSATSLPIETEMPPLPMPPFASYTHSRNSSRSLSRRQPSPSPPSGYSNSTYTKMSLSLAASKLQNLQQLSEPSPSMSTTVGDSGTHEQHLRPRVSSTHSPPLEPPWADSYYGSSSVPTTPNFAQDPLEQKGRVFASSGGNRSMGNLTWIIKNESRGKQGDGRRKGALSRLMFWR